MKYKTETVFNQIRRYSTLSGAIAAVLAQTALGQSVSTESTPTKAQQPSGLLDEIVVTAARRAQDVTEIPYNITAVDAGQLERTGVQSIEDLAQQVPNLVVTSNGRQFLGAQRQIMRGLNASEMNRNGVALEQNPVSTYLGNAPFGNFFNIDDVDRIEVLRGPQGTLYGAGSLGGAIRVIPAPPKMETFEGHVVASAGAVSHSSDQDYGFKAVVNVPIDDSLALRVDAGYGYDA